MCRPGCAFISEALLQSSFADWLAVGDQGLELARLVCQLYMLNVDICIYFHV